MHFVHYQELAPGTSGFQEQRPKLWPCCLLKMSRKVERVYLYAGMTSFLGLKPGPLEIPVYLHTSSLGIYYF